jgi:uncharacterized protein (DUF1697 family)
MAKFVAFLRAINVGGHVVTMEKLRALFEALGFESVETFIASGNVIFESRSTDTGAMERRIEGRLLKALGYEVVTFVRTDAEVAAIARYKPFKESQVQSASAGAFCVGFLAEPLPADGKKSLMTLKTDIDDFHVNGREVYWLCRKRQHESTFSNVRFEKLTKARVTFRGVNTVAKLATKYARPE